MTLADPRQRDDYFTELGDWIDDAACRDANPDWFVWDGPMVVGRVQRAATLCASCPVRLQCDADAEANDAVGVWGGKLRGVSRKRPIDLVARIHDSEYWAHMRQSAPSDRGRLA